MAERQISVPGSMLEIAQATAVIMRALSETHLNNRWALCVHIISVTTLACCSCHRGLPCIAQVGWKRVSWAVRACALRRPTLIAQSSKQRKLGLEPRNEATEYTCSWTLPHMSKPSNHPAMQWSVCASSVELRATENHMLAIPKRGDSESLKAW